MCFFFFISVAEGRSLFSSEVSHANVDGYFLIVVAQFTFYSGSYIIQLMVRNYLLILGRN